MSRQQLCCNKCVWIAGAFLLPLVCPLVAEAGPYQFITLDSPNGPYRTQMYGINDSRQVSGLDVPPDSTDSGLLFINGVGTSIKAPGSIVTDFFQINNAGQIAGDKTGLDGIYHAIVYNSANASVTNLPDVPGYRHNLAGGINNNGLVVGNVFLDDNFTNGVGWFYNGTTYTFFSDPLAAPGQEGTITQSVNDAGLSVGYYADSSGTQHGYLMNGSTFTTIDPPGSTDTTVLGINNAGIITGRYIDSSNVEHGFLDNNGTFTIIDFPGQFGTAVGAINDYGDLAGWYFDQAGAIHGFEALAVPEPSSVSLLAMGVAGVMLYLRRKTSVSRHAVMRHAETIK
jgi:uncharacterized membrane protein